MCCHTEMPCHRHRTGHPTPAQYTDIGLTCRCAIHLCGTSHWNTQLPILMSWVRPDREILHRPSTHIPANAQLGAVMVINSRKLSRKYRTNRVLNPGPVVCEFTATPSTWDVHVVEIISKTMEMIGVLR